MQYFSKFAYVALSAALLLNGCTGKDGAPGPAGAAGTNGTAGPAGPTGPSGQNLTGSITGLVNSADENGTQLSKAGVLVTLDGVTPAVTATSDVDGRFTLTNVRNGTYNLTFSRAGYATFRRLAVSHVGGDQPTFLGTSILSQLSTPVITTFTNGAPSTAQVNVNLIINSPTPTNTFRAAFFASTSPNPTLANGIYVTAVAFGTGGAPTTSYPTSFPISRTSFINAGFASGTTVYVAAFGSTNFFASYIDVATGRVVYPTFNPTSSPVITVVIP